MNNKIDPCHMSHRIWYIWKYKGCPRISCQSFRCKWCNIDKAISLFEHWHMEVSFEKAIISRFSTPSPMYKSCPIPQWNTLRQTGQALNKNSIEVFLKWLYHAKEQINRPTYMNRIEKTLLLLRGVSALNWLTTGKRVIRGRYGYQVQVRTWNIQLSQNTNKPLKLYSGLSKIWCTNILDL